MRDLKFNAVFEELKYMIFFKTGPVKVYFPNLFLGFVGYYANSKR